AVGSYAVRVIVRDRGGSAVTAAAAASRQTQVSGLQAPRVVVAGSPLSFATGDFNGDARKDFAVWSKLPSGQATLQIFLGNADGSYQDSKTVVTQSTNLATIPTVVADFDRDGHADIAANGMIFLG